jgi:hypothetical protein
VESVDGGEAGLVMVDVDDAEVKGVRGGDGFECGKGSC